MKLLFMGLLMGWGAAIPIGPVNLEMMRRNLRFGTAMGLTLGLGACAADFTYVLLLCTGALIILNEPWILQIFGLIGSGLLAWFGIGALRLHAHEAKTELKQKTLFKNFLEGYLMTLMNPFTVLFWLSVSAQVVAITQGFLPAAILTAAGVILGAASWFIGFNLLLHYTRHKLSPKVIHWLNISGGIILLGFALFGFVSVILKFFK